MKKTLIALFVAGLPFAAAATPITIGFSGNVDNDPYGTGWSTFAGQFTYDTAWTDWAPGDDSVGIYPGSGAAYGMQVSVDGGAESWDMYGQYFFMAMLDQYPAIGDQYLVSGGDGGFLTLELALTDSTASILSSDALLAGLPLLSGFDWPRFTLFDTSAEFAGMVTALDCLDGCIPGGGDPGNGGGTPNSVPEPGSLVLAGLGLAALTHARKAR